MLKFAWFSLPAARKRDRNRIFSRGASLGATNGRIVGLAKPGCQSLWPFYLVLAFCFASANDFGQASGGSGLWVPWPGESWQLQANFATIGSPAYRLEVSRLLFKESNKAATELSLPDYLPISVRSTAKLTIFPPRLAKGIQGLGSVITRACFQN
jgi:hypothetical protein